MNNDAALICQHITKDIPPEDFDQLVRMFPGYSFSQGGNCGWNALGIAAYEGNSELVGHIAKKAKEEILNMGNDFGWTPLFCASLCTDVDCGYRAAQVLIDRGADINLATSQECDGCISAPSEATPLWAAVEKTKNVALIKLLLKNGAVANPELSSDGKALLDQVKKESRATGI